MTKEHSEMFKNGNFLEILALGSEVEITDVEMADFLPSFKDFMFCNDLTDPAPPSALLATLIIQHKKEHVYVEYFEAIPLRTYHARLFFQSSTVAFVLMYCPNEIGGLLNLQKKIGSSEIYIFPFSSYVNMKQFYPKIAVESHSSLINYFYEYFSFFNPTTFPYKQGFASVTFGKTFLAFVYMFPIGRFDKKWQDLLLGFEEKTILEILNVLETEYRLSLDSSVTFHKSDELTRSIVGIPEIAAITLKEGYPILRTFFDEKGYVEKYPHLFI